MQNLVAVCLNVRPYVADLKVSLGAEAPTDPLDGVVPSNVRTHLSPCRSWSFYVIWFERTYGDPPEKSPGVLAVFQGDHN